MIGPSYYPLTVRRELAAHARIVSEWGRSPSPAMLAVELCVTTKTAERAVLRLKRLNLIDTETQAPTTAGHAVLADIIQMPADGLHAVEADATIPLPRLPGDVTRYSDGSWSVLLDGIGPATVRVRDSGEFEATHPYGFTASASTLKFVLRETREWCK